MAASYEPPLGVIRLTITTTASTGIIYWPLTTSTGSVGLGDEPLEMLQSAEELRQTQLAAWSREAILAATRVLRTDDVDRTGVLPQRPRSEASESLHARPRFKRRVCAGSSRYRVLRA